MWQRLVNSSLPFVKRQQFAASVLPFPHRTVEILTRTQPNLLMRLGWGEFVPGDVYDA